MTRFELKKKKWPFYLANRPVAQNFDLEVLDKYTGNVAARVAMADAATVETAIQAAHGADKAMRKLAPYQRQEILYHCVRRFEENQEILAQALCIEAGKAIRDAKGEVSRLIDTFRIAAEESVRIQGEVMNLEISPRARGFRGMFKRVPVGPCSFISPFNFPLNLVAHKIAPAIAVGCSFVLKPASRTPIGALMIGEILAETELPEGAFSIVPCRRGDADALTRDERIKLLSFTGSPDVGWDLKAKAGKKKVVLELGGNAACVVDEDADLDDVVRRMVVGAFYQSGQSCIGVQRVMVHESLYDLFKKRFVEATTQLVAGDPSDEQTFLGPMVSEREAKRVESWIQEALSDGARLLCGGSRNGSMMEATLLEDVPKHAKLCAEEIFGPVAVLSSFREFDDALCEINDSRFGLQAGLFTRDIYKIQKAWDELEVGGVVIGDVPSFRVDNMPYGGVKDSGFGREGIRFAMDDMSEIRNLVIRTPRPR